MTSIISSYHASNARRAYHRNAKSQSSRSQDHLDHFKKLRSTFVHMQGTTSSSSLIVTLTGLTSFTWATTPLPPHLITTLLKAFCRTGAPDIVWSDQGPQFTSKPFQDFSKEWGFQHIMSSPMYPQSNGKAEATVKSMKILIKASWTCDALDERKLTRALLQYRNTPSQRDRLSPAQKLFGQPIQKYILCHH